MKKYAKEFRLSTAPQRSPEWYAERAGKPTASGLGFLFDRLRDGKTLSAKAKKYLRELAFERKFGVTYDRFDTKAMQEGRYYEDFAKKLYAKETGSVVTEAFSYVSDWFVATPDANVQEVVKLDKERTVLGKKGLLECKILGDESFLQFIEDGVPLEHELQTQGQLLASGLDWVDYIVVNIKTKAYVIMRQYRNAALIKRIYERLHEPLDLPEINTDHVRYFDETQLTDFKDGAAIETAQLIIKDLPF